MKAPSDIVSANTGIALRWTHPLYDAHGQLMVNMDSEVVRTPDEPSWRHATI